MKMCFDFHLCFVFAYKLTERGHTRKATTIPDISMTYYIHSAKNNSINTGNETKTKKKKTETKIRTHKMPIKIIMFNLDLCSSRKMYIHTYIYTEITGRCYVHFTLQTGCPNYLYGMCNL